eukprot:2014051-Prymnesium_polylepis.1
MTAAGQPRVRRCTVPAQQWNAARAAAESRACGAPGISQTSSLSGPTTSLIVLSFLTACLTVAGSDSKFSGSSAAA